MTEPPKIATQVWIALAGAIVSSLVTAGAILIPTTIRDETAMLGAQPLSARLNALEAAVRANRQDIEAIESACVQPSPRAGKALGTAAH